MLSAHQYLQENDIILESDTGDIVLNEIYFGVIPQLLVIEDLFDKLKNSYKKMNINNLKEYRKLINDPILKKIGLQLCDAFGFKNVYITIDKRECMNAYTIGIPVDKKGNTYDEKEVPFEYDKLVGTVKMTNGGFKFDSRKFGFNMLACLTYGILFKSPITTKELIAVLLHEIGHTFSKVIYNHKLLTGRVDEKFADNFAAMYGYAEHLVSAFSKMSMDYGDIERVIKQVPILGAIVGINRTFNSIVGLTLINDPHPVLYKRMEDLIKSLENELKATENMPPEMKKDIENQLQRSKELLDNFVSKDSNDLSDYIVKGTAKYIETNHPIENWREKEADKVASPYKIDKRVGEVYKQPTNDIRKRVKEVYHKKGFFR